LKLSPGIDRLSGRRKIMIIGVPKEVKDQEYRVAVVPGGVRALSDKGHRVLVEAGAGEGSGIGDGEYVEAGAEIVDKELLFKEGELVVKVKEPVEEEYHLLRPGLILFTFLHLASDRARTSALMDRGVTAVAYETIESETGGLPLLAPMSEVAGKLSVQVGAALLQKNRGGPGILLGGVPGVRHGRVAILGGGTVGTNAARVALGLGAEVSILDVDLQRLGYLDDIFQGKAETLMSNGHNIEEAVLGADLLVGAVLVTGARAPVLVSEEMVKRMRPGSVIVDVAVDQGGSVETIRPTTHSDPTYVTGGVIHYGVTNMPSLVPRTSTYALTNSTFPYLEAIARKGLTGAMREDSSLRPGVNIFEGRLVHPKVAEAHGLPCLDLPE
jgi:alanine dehydrogenase